MNQSRKIIEGAIYNDLTVIEAYSTKCKSQCGQIQWKSRVRCICGIEKEVYNYGLLQNRIKSCGCSHGSHIDYSIGDKRGRTPTYQSWSAMMSRCYQRTNPRANYYKNKGITVCDRWHNFENFLKDMGDRPKDKTIDRKDNGKGYHLDNCRWATPLEQTINSKTAKLKVEEVQLIKKICKESNFKDSFICKMFKVSRASINNIRESRTWKGI